MNRCIFLGNLTRDPELRVTPTGKAVVSFSIAINRRSSADREETLFMECEAWEKRAEAIAKFFGKGRQILVEGHLRQENWEDKTTGQKRSRFKLVVEAFHFTGRKDEATRTDDPPAPSYGEASPPSRGYGEASTPSPYGAGIPAPNLALERPTTAAAAAPDEDVPF